MPTTYSRTFRVRHYELDGYGHVNNAMYLRYMQEAAFDASAAAGYPPERYRTLQRTWLIHETGIAYLRPLTYGDQVTVTTWVADFARVRSRREYAFHLGAAAPADPEATTGLVARAYSDWVFLDAVTGRPTAIPPEMVTAFQPTAAAPLKRQPFPAPPPAPSGAFTARRAVEWRDMDTAGHVNNANYLAYVSECAFAASAACGWPAERLWEAGYAILAREHHIQYQQPAVFADELAVTTWLSEPRAASFLRHFVITRVRDGVPLTRINTRYVWADRRTLRPVRAPQAILADFAGQLAG